MKKPHFSLPELLAYIWYKGFGVYIFRGCHPPKRLATVLHITATLPDNPNKRSSDMIAFTKGNTFSNLNFVPMDKPSAEGGVAVPVDGTPTVVISDELASILTYEVDATGTGFNGKLTAAADIGNEVLTGTVTASVDADPSSSVSLVVGVLTVNINPALMASVVEITASDPVDVVV